VENSWLNRDASYRADSSRRWIWTPLEWPLMAPIAVMRQVPRAHRCVHVSARLMVISPGDMVAGPF
jgi:hypothetical protein